jgi:uncharacterized protein
MSYSHGFRLFWSAIVIAIFTACSPKIAQKAIVPTPTFPTTTIENALLWEISGNKITKPSYLFGTIHIIGKEDYFLPIRTNTALSAAQKVVFEINMEDMSDMGKQMGLLSKAMMRNDTTLQQLLSKEDYSAVNQHFTKIGMPLFMLERMKPMFLSIFAETGDDKLSNGDMKSYEMELFDIAKKQKKKIGGLETAEYQLSMFDSIPYREQADMLVKGIRSKNNGKDQLQQMVNLYKDQNISALYNMIVSDTTGIANHGNLLLDNRNRNWVPIMEKMMTDTSTFFAVGAGHLGGEKGVITLLRKRGYTVKSYK